MNWIIWLGAILVLVILYMIFRIGNLVGLVKDKKEEEFSISWNTMNAYLMLAFMVFGLGGFFWYSYAHFSEYTLPVASIHGAITDNLFWITMWVTVIAFAIIFVVMFWFTFVYRYDKERKAVHFADNTKLEILWTVVPAIVLTLLVIRGLSVWSNITGPASKDAVVVEMVGQQWLWMARYPGVVDKTLGHHNYKLIDASNEFGLDLTDKNSFDDFKSLTLHIPVDQEILLKIRAKDVLHSVFLPHFRVKMDAVPGVQTHFKFTANKTTAQMREELNNPLFNYEMACTEVCGKGHFSMKFPVVVDTQEEYEAWLASQQSWLKQNPEYLKYVPAELKEAAMLKAGIELDNVTTVQTAAIK
jgi:cytochrome c oxidase subunit II